jgi:hypothetical protein
MYVIILIYKYHQVKPINKQIVVFNRINVTRKKKKKKSFNLTNFFIYTVFSFKLKNTLKSNHFVLNILNVIILRLNYSLLKICSNLIKKQKQKRSKSNIKLLSFPCVVLLLLLLFTFLYPRTILYN